MPTTTWRCGELSIEGSSSAGDATWFRVHPPGLALDAGRGAPQLAGARDLFLSHGHLDHALGVPYLASERSLHGGGRSTRIFCPAPIEPDLRAFLAAAACLERASYDFELRGLEPGERVAVGPGLAVEAFAVDHVVPSLGYHLWRGRRRLQERYRGAAEDDLRALRRRGEAVEEEFEELWLSYASDTGAGVFETEPRIFEARVLMLECTFLDAAHRDRGALYGHLHFEDIAARAERFRNPAILLYHLSRRHRAAELRREIAARLPELAARIHVWGE